MKQPQIHEDLWPYILTLLPSDLEIQARQTGALIRARGVKGAEQLLRMIMAYGITGQSLKGIVAWAKSIEIADMSASAFFYKLQDSVEWMSQLLSGFLNELLKDPPGSNGYRLRIIDTTCVKSPGEKAPYWRVHTFMDSLTGRISNIEISDKYHAESLLLHPIQENDLVLADRVYAKARAIAEITRKKATVLVRFNPHHIRLCGQNHEPVDWLSIEKQVPLIGGIEFKFLMPEPPPQTNSHKSWLTQKALSWLEVRVVAGRTKNGNIIWLLTTAPKDRLHMNEVLELYRFRWQIELLFKRLKSILNFDKLPAKTEPLAKAWLLARLLAAALIERLLYEDEPFSPWGYRIRRVQ
jgi:hypothetical protein